MGITEVSIIHHACIVLLGLWLLSEFNWCHPVAYLISLIYLYLVHECYVMRLQKKLQFEERKKSYQRRALADSETVRWLNHAVEKIWPVCMEQIASQKILLPIIPWFLEKYKPWTAKKAVVQRLYLGRNPPIFTEMRVLRQGSEDDHLVLELGLNFLTAEDMSAILAVKLRKRLGFGMWARLHITGMHVEGKVLIGVKFVQGWPFLGRLRVCFAEPPYFQMTVKPIFTHGIDVTEVPGIAGWLDNLLSVAFEQTLVQPNMLVVNVEKFAAPQQEPWFSVDEKDPLAFVKVEVIEAADMKPADLNGLADPYVKGQLGPYRFKTKIQKKTLSPKWLEEFRVPIVTWETPNVLNFKVCDKDHMIDDALGKYSVNVNDLRDGRRHDTWVPLQDVKMGRLHLAITVLEENGKGDPSVQGDADSSVGESLCTEEKPSSFAERTNGGSFPSRSSEKSPRLADKFEPIDVDGQKETGMWIQQPGSEVSQTWEPRKGKTRRGDAEIIREQTDPLATELARTPGGTASEKQEEKHPENPARRLLSKFISVFHRNPKKDDHVNIDDVVPSLHVNVQETSSSKIGVNLIVEKDLNLSHEGSRSEGPEKENVEDKAKVFLEQAEKQARSLEPALSKKGPRRSHGGDSSVETIPSDSESTGDDSLPPSIYTPRVDNTIEIASQPFSSGGASYSPKSMEKVGVSTDSSEITTDSGNVMKERVGPIDDISSPKLSVTNVMEETGVKDGLKA